MVQAVTRTTQIEARTAQTENRTAKIEALEAFNQVVEAHLLWEVHHQAHQDLQAHNLAAVAYPRDFGNLEVIYFLVKNAMAAIAATGIGMLTFLLYTSIILMIKNRLL